MLNGASIGEVKKIRYNFKTLYQPNTHEKGVYCNLNQKLGLLLPLVYKNLIKDIPDIDLDIFHLKFCVDGTNVGNNKIFLNFNFSIINEQNKCKTAFGHYVIGIFSIDKEDYETMSDCLALIFDQIEEVTNFTINGKQIGIEKHLGGDLKSLLNLAGINAASSHYGCLWCKCPKTLYHDYNIEWSITDPEKGARSHEEARDKMNLKPVENLGYALPAISCFFPFYRHIIDLLHLRLRITDKLNDYLFEKILEKPNKDPNYRDPLNEKIRNPLVGRMNQFLTNECKILKPIIISEDSNNSFKNTYKIRNLRGGDQIKFYKKIIEKDENNVEIHSIERMFPELGSNLSSNIQSLYRDFFSIYTAVKTNSTDVYDIKIRASQWLKLFTNTYLQRQVTPYMHAFAHHLYQFKELYPNLNDFNQEGHEKFNDIETAYYFRATNKKHNTINQLMEKFNRVELMRLGFVF
jgi:hypothetical protein